MNLLDYEPQRKRWTWEFTWFAIAAAVCLGVFLFGCATLTYRTMTQPTTAPVAATPAAGSPGSQSR